MDNNPPHFQIPLYYSNISKKSLLRLKENAPARTFHSDSTKE